MYPSSAFCPHSLGTQNAWDQPRRYYSVQNSKFSGAKESREEKIQEYLGRCDESARELYKPYRTRCVVFVYFLPVFFFSLTFSMISGFSRHVGQYQSSSSSGTFFMFRQPVWNHWYGQSSFSQATISP